MKIFILTFLLSFPFMVIGQSSVILKNANNEFGRKHYKSASELYEKYYSLSNDNSILVKVAMAHAKYGNLQEALKSYESAIALDTELSEEDLLLYARILVRTGEFEDAKSILQNVTDTRKKQNLLRSIENYDDFSINAELYQVSELSINSSMSDFSLIKYDTGYLFTSNRVFKGKPDSEREYNFFDLYFFTSKDFINFSEVIPFKQSFDSRGNDGPIAFFPGETKAIISRNNYYRGIRGITHRGKNEIELYEIDQLSDGNWGKLERLPFDDNDYSSFHPTISNDGSWMIFASNRPGGFGKSDLYRVNYDNGKWSTPENLGDKVNTSGSELFPTLVGDTVLYFSSDNHVGMGGLDLYSFSLTSDSLQNLGAPFNSPDDDFSLHQINSKKWSVSSNRGNEIGDDDLLLIEQIKEKPVVQVPVPVIVPPSKVWLISNLVNPSQGLTSDGSEEYLFQFTKDSLIFEGDGPSKVNAVIANKSKQETLNSAIAIEKLTVIEPVYFGFDVDAISDQAAKSLVNLTVMLNESKELQITLFGYTDSKGSASYNQVLGKRRANSVKKKLIALGISANRISTKSMGEEALYSDCKTNCTKQEYQLERRVEIVIR